MRGMEKFICGDGIGKSIVFVKMKINYFGGRGNTVEKQCLVVALPRSRHVDPALTMPKILDKLYTFFAKIETR